MAPLIPWRGGGVIVSPKSVLERATGLVFLGVAEFVGEGGLVT